MGTELLFKLLREKNIKELDELYEKVGTIEVKIEEFTEFCVEGNTFAMDQVMLRFDRRRETYDVFLFTPIKDNPTEEDFDIYVNWLFDRGLVRSSLLVNIKVFELADKFNKQDVMKILLCSSFQEDVDKVRELFFIHPNLLRLYITSRYTEQVSIPGDVKVSPTQLAQFVEDEKLYNNPQSFSKLIKLCSIYNHGFILKLFQNYHSVEGDKIFLMYIFRDLFRELKFQKVSLHEMKEIFKMDMFTIEWKYYYFHFLRTLTDGEELIKDYFELLDNETLKGIIKFLGTSQLDRNLLKHCMIKFNHLFTPLTMTSFVDIMNADQIIEILESKHADENPDFVDFCLKIFFKKYEFNFNQRLLDLCQSKYSLLFSQIKNRILYSLHITAWPTFFNKILSEALLNDKLDLEFIIVKLFILSNFHTIERLIKVRSQPDFTFNENDKYFFVRTTNKILIFVKEIVWQKYLLKNILRNIEPKDEQMCPSCHEETNLFKLSCNHTVCCFCFIEIGSGLCSICRQRTSTVVSREENVLSQNSDLVRKDYLEKEITDT